MHAFPKTPRGRTVLGMVLAASFVPVMLGITACLDTPVGDPEQGWADPRISGAWLEVDPVSGDRSANLWLFDPWDRRTWLVTWVPFEDAASSAPADGVEGSSGEAPAAADGATEEAVVATPATPLAPADVERILAALGDEHLTEASGAAVFKGWLTSIGNQRFLVLEPKSDPSTERGFLPEEWWVVRVVLKGEQMELAALDYATDGLDEVRTRGEAEAIIAKHAADPDFYESPTVLQRIPQSAYDEVDAALDRSGLNY